MNYYGPLELRKDGKGTGLWHYTCSNKRTGTYAVGYCSPWDNCPECAKGLAPWGWVRNEDGTPKLDENQKPIKCGKCEGRGLVAKEDPCPGHPSKEEACDHYKQYQLDRLKIRGPKEQQWPKEKCCVDGCEEVATMLADIPGDMHHFELCPAHANRETVEKMYRVGESWSSY